MASSAKISFLKMLEYLILGMILAMMILTLGLYVTENIVRGIYNEEIKYVKTNKQRFDWN